MKNELLQPAATIAVDLLRRKNPLDGQITEKEITESFLRAYRGLLAAQEQLSQEGGAASVQAFQKLG